MSVVDQILDPENTENIVIYDDTGEPVEFEQIAVIPIDENVYVIMRPIIPFPGFPADTGFVFAIEDTEDDEILVLIEKQETIGKVFAEYEELLRQANEG